MKKYIKALTVTCLLGISHFWDLIKFLFRAPCVLAELPSWSQSHLHQRLGGSFIRVHLGGNSFPLRLTEGRNAQITTLQGQRRACRPHLEKLVFWWQAKLIQPFASKIWRILRTCVWWEQIAFRFCLREGRDAQIVPCTSNGEHVAAVWKY